jgi:signal transduction histidine kinase
MLTKKENFPEVNVQYLAYKERELIIANKELAFQNKEKEKRAAELLIANKELVFQNEEKEKRAAELVIANKELVFQNEEKEKRAAELVIANKELIFQNKEKEKRAVELIEAKEKAEESDRLKTAFLNNISHEIRTPFNGILGFLSIIQDHDLPDEEREEYICIINQSADRLMNTINEIVEISQIQSGIVKLTVQETNIKKLLDELFDQFNSIAESKGLEFNINNELPNNIASISTDGIKLKTILSNLIGNAMKFTKAGSIDLEIRQKGDYLEFSLKDTGVGISKNNQLVIFERFMQADVSRTREYEGLGLGLSIATAYVKMLGGKIWAKSEEGKGSTFFFTIK